MKKTIFLIGIFCLVNFSLVAQKKPNIDVPFSVIERVPIYQGCRGNNEQLKNCMNNKIRKHISKKFNTDLASDLGLSDGIKRINVQFVIDENGDVIDIKAKGPHPKLELEAKRIIRLLPKFTPGKQGNKAVRVSYSIPIVIKVEDESISKKTNSRYRSNEVYNPKKEYDASYKNILSKKYDGKWFKSSEAKKIVSYLNKNQYDKAEKFCVKRNNLYRTISRKAILSEKYYLRAKDLISMSKYTEAINVLERAQVVYSEYRDLIKKGYKTYSQRYPVEKKLLKLIDRELGVSYIEVSKGTVSKAEKNKFIKLAFDNFNKTNSYDLLKENEISFSIIHLEEFEKNEDYEKLEKIFKAFSNSNNIEGFEKTCSSTARYYLQIYQKNKIIEDADKAILLSKKVKDVELLDHIYETIAITIINSTKKPKSALDYIKKISNVDETKINKYNKLINQKLVKDCKNFDDCIKVLVENPSIKSEIVQKTISLAKTIDDCVQAENYFPKEKELVYNKMIENIKTLEDGKKVLGHIPVRKNEIEQKTLEISSSFEDLNYIFENFTDLAPQAEQKALDKISSLSDKKQFVKHFKTSSYLPQYLAEIKNEEEKIKKRQMKRDAFNLELNTVGEEMGQIIMDAHHRNGKWLNVNAGGIRIEKNIATIDFKARWSATSTLGDKILDFSIEFPININLETEKVSIGWVKNMFDGQQYHLKKFNRVKSQIIRLAQSLVDDIKDFNKN